MKGVLPVLLLATLVAISYSMKEIEVFRLYGFQKGGQVYGSKIASFSLVGAHYQGDVLRQVAIIRFQEITSQNIQQIISRRASGILIVLPQKNSVVENENEVWPIIYSNLINQTLYIPVFFTWENQDVNNLYNNEKERVTKNLQDLQEYKIAVTSEEPKLLPQVNYEDYFAYFEELNTYRTGISSILVVANYDTLTPSADLKLGFGIQSSAFLSFLLFMKKIVSIQNQFNSINNNILFYLTASKYNEFDGLKQWLSLPENSIHTGAIEYIFILDNLSEKQSIHLDMYYPNSENMETDLFLQTIREQSAQNNFELQEKISKEKILEIKKDIITFRISDFVGNDKSLIENSQIKSMINFKRKVNLLTDIFSQMVFANYTQNLVKEANTWVEGEEDLYQRYYKNLTAINRFPSQLAKEEQSCLEIRKLFLESGLNLVKHQYNIKDKKYFSSQPIKAQIYKHSDPLLNLYLFGGILVWLAVLYWFTSKTPLLSKVHRE